MINTIKHLSVVLGCSENHLLHIIDNIDQFYYRLEKPKMKYGLYQCDKKGNVKFRKILASGEPLKQIQRKIHDILSSIKTPVYAFGAVRHKNNILNARQHLGNRYFFSADLKDFFTSIRHHQVFGMFLKNNFSPTISRLLTKLTTYQGRLPQGPPSSSIIANLVFVPTGDRLHSFARENSITFTSFLDDLSFSSKKEFKPLIQHLIDIIRSGGFYLNHKKVSYKVSRPEITGAIIHVNRLRPIDLMKERARTNPYVAAYLKRFENSKKYSS
jgi:RNA-directed DNA polymerase